MAQVVPIVVTSLANKKMPNLGAILDWRKAAPEITAATTVIESSAGSEPAKVQAEPPLPPLDPKAMSHFIAIQSALTPGRRRSLAREVAAELSPAELRAWFNELSALSVPDAVAKIRLVHRRDVEEGRGGVIGLPFMTKRASVRSPR